MSTAKERLLAAVERLCADTEAVVLSHHDLHCGCDGEDHSADAHKPGQQAKKIDPNATATNQVGTLTACKPAATGEAGHIRIPVPVATFDREIPGLQVMHTLAGTLVSHAYDAMCTSPIPAGETHIEVHLPQGCPIGPYVGMVTDATGTPLTPVVIYLDGLS